MLPPEDRRNPVLGWPDPICRLQRLGVPPKTASIYYMSGKPVSPVEKHGFWLRIISDDKQRAVCRPQELLSGCQEPFPFLSTSDRGKRESPGHLRGQGRATHQGMRHGEALRSVSVSLYNQLVNLPVGGLSLSRGSNWRITRGRQVAGLGRYVARVDSGPDVNIRSNICQSQPAAVSRRRCVEGGDMPVLAIQVWR